MSNKSLQIIRNPLITCRVTRIHATLSRLLPAGTGENYEIKDLRIAGVLAEIRIKHLPNTNPDRRCYVKPLCKLLRIDLILINTITRVNH
jgi:hypothetical protein